MHFFESILLLGNISIGVHNVTYVASDASGNMASCRFSVVVLASTTSTDGSSASSGASPALAGGAGGGAIALILVVAIVVVVRMRRNSTKVMFRDRDLVAHFIL